MRLFIALPLPVHTHVALGTIIRDLKQASAGVRWVQPDNIHLTLRFLGDTDPLLVPELKHLVDRTAQQQAALELNLNRLGAFPNLRKPRVYWISTTDPNTTRQLCNFAEGIEGGVRELGFQAEHKIFRPHLTLGRVKQPENLDRLRQAIETYGVPPLLVPLTRISLIQSTLTPKGAIHEHLHDSPLAEAQPTSN